MPVAVRWNPGNFFARKRRTTSESQRSPYSQNHESAIETQNTTKTDTKTSCLVPSYTNTSKNTRKRRNALRGGALKRDTRQTNEGPKNCSTILSYLQPASNQSGSRNKSLYIQLHFFFKFRQNHRLRICFFMKIHKIHILRTHARRFMPNPSQHVFFCYLHASHHT